MKTSFILLASAITIALFLALDLSAIETFTFATALGIIAVLGIDFDRSRDTARSAKIVTSPMSNSKKETNPLAA